MADKWSKNSRVLDLYVRLCEGKIINKAEEAKRFQVDERSIQRDIDDIRAFINNSVTEHGTQCEKHIVYDRVSKGYKVVGNTESIMSNSEILAASKILLESRAFTKKEMDALLDKLINGCASKEYMKLVRDAVRNEKYHYVELCHKSKVMDKLWELNEEIQHCEILEITYEKQVASKEMVTRMVEPVAILFSEFYFYLNAYIVEKDDKGKYVRKFDYPAIFRIDRIIRYRATGEKFSMPYASRFEEGEYRKRVQFMYAGNLHKCQFRYSGRNKEAVFDRLPTAELKYEDESGYVFEVETYGRGIMMWLLSQGTNATVLGPESFKERMKQEIQEMLEQYK